MAESTFRADKPGQPVRIRLGSTTAGVKHEGEPQNSEVSVLYTQDQGLPVRARAGYGERRLGTKHIVLDLDTAGAAGNQFHRSPCLIVKRAPAVAVPLQNGYLRRLLVRRNGRFRRGSHGSDFTRT